MAADERVARELLAALDARDPDTALTFLAEDIAFRFCSAEASVGRAAVASAAATMAGVVASMSHKMLAVWATGEPDPAVICETAVTYVRHDGSEVTLPCVSIFRVRDGLVADYRIYMDINPVFAAQTS
jgi:ketosteroid isomerase-like protein